jgi:hypothetical protein
MFLAIKFHLIDEIFQMTAYRLHLPFGWLFNARFKKKERKEQQQQQQQQHQQRKKGSNTGNTKASYYYATANTQQQEGNQQHTLKHALDLLKDQRSLIYKIYDAITDNELSSQSKNTYTSDELGHIIKQKYFPPASNDYVHSVLQHLAEDHTKVAAQTKHISPPEQTMLYQSRAYHNHIYGLENKNKQRFCSRPF